MATVAISRVRRTLGTFHLTTMLIVHAAWYQIIMYVCENVCARGVLRAAFASLAAQLSLVVVVLFHWYAGLSKIFVSGLWADGVMQVWIHLWGYD